MDRVGRRVRRRPPRANRTHPTHRRRRPLALSHSSLLPLPTAGACGPADFHPYATSEARITTVECLVCPSGSRRSMPGVTRVVPHRRDGGDPLSRSWFRTPSHPATPQISHAPRGRLGAGIPPPRSCRIARPRVVIVPSVVRSRATAGWEARRRPADRCGWECRGPKGVYLTLDPPHTVHVAHRTSHGARPAVGLVEPTQHLSPRESVSSRVSLRSRTRLGAVHTPAGGAGGMVGPVGLYPAVWPPAAGFDRLACTPRWIGRGR